METDKDIRKAIDEVLQARAEHERSFASRDVNQMEATRAALDVANSNLAILLTILDQLGYAIIKR